MSDRPYRTAPDRCFSGGYVGHGRIEPLPSVFDAHRKHVGPVRYAFARFLVPVVVFGAVVVGFAAITNRANAAERGTALSSASRIEPASSLDQRLQSHFAGEQ